MGSGASSNNSPCNTPEPQSKLQHASNGKPVATAKPLEVDDQKTHLVRTNQVAPIIIKNCKEEFQHVTDFKEPIVHGRIAEGMPEHALIRSKYFMVKDVSSDIDKLGTLTQYCAPNVRKCKGNYPVYGMGQPTKDGLTTFMHTLKDEGYKDILLFNFREEPVLFVKEGFDLIPYSPRHQDDLHLCLTHRGASSAQTAQLEAQIRKETIDLAAFKEDQKFYFYNDIATFKDEPHMYRVAYEDDLAVTDEVYSRLAFNNTGIRYVRLPLPPDGAPMESDFDHFVDLFRGVHPYFSGKEGMPAVVFTSRSGISRSSLGMIMGTLMAAHKQGFPPEAQKKPYQINEKSPNFERGEFAIIQRLVSYLPKGLQLKQEVDSVIDLCMDLVNFRSITAESKHSLESIHDDYIIEGRSAKETLLHQCMKHLETYFYLVCFNAYIHEQYGVLFATPFSQWMRDQSQLYEMLSLMDVSERHTTPDLLSKGIRHLVSDDYLGLDILSSQMDVKTSNFRRVLGLPVYGMAQPSREGLSCVVNHLLSKKQGHVMVVLFNLREDLVIECDGATFSPREADNLEEPVIMPGISASEIEAMEEELKKEIKQKKTFQVYQEINGNAESREFNSVLTPVDMYQQLKMQASEFYYHRIPMGDDKAPAEKIFDLMLSVINGINEIYTDEDGPALVFQCRTGKGRTTTAMAIAGLIVCHKKGFPYGTKPGEEERVSLPNATYTKGNYHIVQELVKRIPNGQQVKREVDFILDQCSDTMTPMHYHVREVIFVTYNKIKKAKTEEDKTMRKKRSLDFLERYVYLILFNQYLHCERRRRWQKPFSKWMKEVAAKAGVYELLDSLAFYDFEPSSCKLKSRRSRWSVKTVTTPFRGHFV